MRPSLLARRTLDENQRDPKNLSTESAETKKKERLVLHEKPFQGNVLEATVWQCPSNGHGQYVRSSSFNAMSMGPVKPSDTSTSMGAPIEI